jgi:ATP-binding cassette, subfamily B, multidrug efflux pump
MERFRKFSKYFRRYKWHVAFGIFCILISMSFSLLVPYIVGLAIDDLSAGITTEKAVKYPLFILGSSLIGGVFLFWQRRLLINASRYIEHEMRDDFYSSLVNQPLEFFHRHRVGDLMARATNDLAAVRQIVGPMILYSFQAIFALLVVIPLMLSINWKLTLLMLIPMPLVSLTVKYLGAQIHTRFEKIQEYFSGITARAQENLSGVRVIRAYAQETAEIETFKDLNREYADKNAILVRYSAAMRPLLFFFIGIGFVIIVAVGIPMAIRGEISPGDFTAFILYLQRMVWYLIALGYVVNLYQRGTASLKRFDEILETVPSIGDAPGATEQPKIKGRIEFRDLSFSYDGIPVLKNINLTVEAGQTVAFVGRTGAGKSTLVNLIPRLMDVADGSLFLDGIEIRKFPISQLREAIGFVPQETFLFSDTISYNIRFGLREDESEAGLSVEKAADIACLAEDIGGFPFKYDQLVGERGIALSGGQKQRTAIARAVMRNPRILILDDSLSAVDTFTEERILRNLREVRSGRTTLIVAHRVSTIKDADLICFVEHGEIVESGTHQQLLELGGLYAELHQRQLLEEEIEGTD